MPVEHTPGGGGDPPHGAWSGTQTLPVNMTDYLSRCVREKSILGFDPPRSPIVPPPPRWLAHGPSDSSGMFKMHHVVKIVILEDLVCRFSSGVCCERAVGAPDDSLSCGDSSICL